MNKISVWVMLIAVSIVWLIIWFFETDPIKKENCITRSCIFSAASFVV